MKNPSAKTKAIIAYITFVGFIIAFSMNRDDKHEFATWHIKNMFGLLMILLVAQVSQAYVHLRFGEILWLIAFVLWIYSWIMAMMNKQQGIPILSKKFQQWFTFLN